MQDTPDFIRQKQFEIIAQKSNAEKLQMTIDDRIEFVNGL
jgi:hypothetical protein